MTEKSPLHQVLELIINEEEDKATSLLHNEIIRMSRQIHEELQSEEDSVLEDEQLSENFDPQSEMEGIEAQEHYGDGLSEDDEHPEGEDEAEVDLAADLGAEGEEPMMGAEGEGMEGAEMGAEGDLQAEVADLKDQLEALKAEFDALAAGEEHEEEKFPGIHEEPGEEGGEEEAEGMEGEVEEGDGGIYGANAGGDDDWEPEELGKGTGMGDPGEGIYEEIDLDDFEDLAEANLWPLEKVDVEGKKVDQIGTGGEGIKQNDSSIMPEDVAKDVSDRLDFEPDLMSEKSEHAGFDLEKAPAVKDVGKFRNSMKTWDANTSKVSKEGDKSAVLNKVKSDGFSEEQKVSPISGKMKPWKGTK
jgi:hypothetical protein